MIRGWRAVLAAALLAAAAAPARAFWWGQTARGFWLTRDLSIDGNPDDWKLDDTQLGDAYGLSFAFANDEGDLYVLVIPHTEYAKNQLAGAYGQTFTLWLDPGAGTRKVVGVRLHPPSGQARQRMVEIVVDTAAASSAGLDLSADAAVSMGPLTDRGAFEARIPRGYFQNPAKPPKRISVALEASVPAAKPPPIKRAPSSWAAQGQDIPPPGQDGGGQTITSAIQQGLEKTAAGRAKEPAEPEEFEPIGFWIRVTLAKPPTRPDR